MTLRSVAKAIRTVGALSIVALGCAGNDDVEFDSSVTFATVPPSTPTTAAPEPTPPATNQTTSVTPTASTSTTAPSDNRPLVEPEVALVAVGQFERPVDVAVRPLDTRAFVIEQTGRVLAVDDESTSAVLEIGDRITTEGNEQGLLGLAFHPELDLAYVAYTDTDGDTVVAEFAVDPDTGVFDPASFREVLTVDQPFRNHNGGKLEFGPDGLLYIGLGDGGSSNDPGREALDLSSRLGKILRIDPVGDGGAPFTNPADNPFVAVEGADPTIWSVGLRNPWRFSFDAATGDLWIADVGQNAFEEINRAPAVDGHNAGRGLSFGWSALEGNTPVNGDQPADGHTAPVLVYPHQDGRCSVSGGVVARDDGVADLAGWFVFGDYCTGEILAFDPASPPESPRLVPLGSLAGLVAVSAGPDGEVYATSNAGTIARLTTP